MKAYLGFVDDPDGDLLGAIRLTEEQAYQATADIIRANWEDLIDAEDGLGTPDEIEAERTALDQAIPTFIPASAVHLMEVLRGTNRLRCEVAPVDIDAATVRALFSQIQG